MPRRKQAEPLDGEVDTAGEQSPPEAPSEPVAPPSPTSEAVTVVTPHSVPYGPPSGYRRVFSKRDHGDSYKEDAEAYRKRFDGVYE